MNGGYRRPSYGVYLVLLFFAALAFGWAFLGPLAVGLGVFLLVTLVGRAGRGIRRGGNR